MTTESVSIRYRDLDIWPTREAVEAMWEAQMSAIAAVREALPSIASAADAIAQHLKRGGRIVYAGAGASGRIAMQDGVELAPTFGWPRERVDFLMAGGEPAMFASIEGAEDDVAAARAAVADTRIGAADALIAVAASGSTPFTLEAVRAARAAGALTVGVANNADASLVAQADIGILVDSGSEAIAGSTRMKAGAAQKVVLAILSSAIMMRLGGVYDGMMVGMRPVNAKLKNRAVRMVARICDCSPESARSALEASEYDVKRAVLQVSGASCARARDLLRQTQGNLREALSLLRRASP